jgi:hypothetical protein
MKKITLFLLLSIVVLTVPAFSQETAQGQWVIGVGAMGGVPVGDFSNASNFGIGGGGWVGYSVDPNLTITGKVGYMNFSSKVSGGPSLSMVPVLVGGRYFLTPSLESSSMRSYVAGDVGIYNASASGTSSSKFGIAPTLGAQFQAGEKMNVDVYANYTIIFTDPSSTSWVGFGVGLEFGM